MTENASPARTTDVAALAARFTTLSAQGNGAQALIEAMALSPRDDEARAATALCWALLGNPIHAEAEVAGVDPARLSPAGLKAVRALRERLPSEARAAREALARRREENLAILAEHQPDLAERFRGAELDPSSTWARIGSKLAMVDLVDGKPSFVVESCPEPELEGLRRALGQGESLLLGEMRAGILLTRLAAARPRDSIGRQVPIYVLEPSVARFVLHLSVGSFRNYAGGGSVRFFVGADAMDVLLEALRRDPFLLLPRSITYGGPEVVRKLEAAWTEAVSQVQAHQASIGSYYATMTPGRLIERLDGRDGDPPRVLCVTSRFTTVLQYVARDVAQAFESLGCRTHTLKETSDIGWYTAHPLARTFDEFRPDLVLLIDHVRAEYPTWGFPPVPFICWIQDPMPQLFDAGLASKLGALDFTYAVVPEWRERCLSLGYRDVGVLPMGVNPELFCPGAPDPRLACDVAFASHVKLPVLCERYPTLLPHLVDEMLRAPIGTIQDLPFFGELLTRVETRLGVQVVGPARDGIIEDLSLTLPRYAHRVPPVQWAREAGLGVKLFGDGWGSIPGLSNAACGKLGNGEPLRDLYRSAKVNLHVNQGGLNLHQRLFECLASGGFLLVRSLPSDTQPGGLGESFEIGREVVTFEGKEDYLEKLKKYIADDRARQEVVEAGRARVLAGHTYAHRMQVVLADVRARLERLAAGGAR